jgi:hypothetical protein
MKRAIEIMESKDEIKRTFTVEEGRFHYEKADKEVIELCELFKMIRRHTGKIERESYK